MPTYKFSKHVVRNMQFSYSKYDDQIKISETVIYQEITFISLPGLCLSLIYTFRECFLVYNGVLIFSKIRWFLSNCSKMIQEYCRQNGWKIFDVCSFRKLSVVIGLFHCKTVRAMFPISFIPMNLCMHSHVSHHF